MDTTDPTCQNRLRFGDNTIYGFHPDYSAQWFFVRLYDGSLDGGVCGDPEHPRPVHDLNKDCVVDLLDLQILLQHWLQDTRP